MDGCFDMASQEKEQKKREVELVLKKKFQDFKKNK